GEAEVDTVRFPRELVDPIQPLPGDGGIGLHEADLTQRACFRGSRGQLRTNDGAHPGKLYGYRAADQASEIRLNHCLLWSAPRDDVFCAPRQRVRPDPDFDAPSRPAVHGELETLRRRALL